jgi:hypothetical protein
MTATRALLIAWAIAAVAAVAVYRNAAARRARLGTDPGGLAPGWWAVVVLLLGLLGLLFYGISVVGQERSDGEAGDG